MDGPKAFCLEDKHFKTENYVFRCICEIEVSLQMYHHLSGHSHSQIQLVKGNEFYGSGRSEYTYTLATF